MVKACCRTRGTGAKGTGTGAGKSGKLEKKEKDDKTKQCKGSEKRQIEAHRIPPPTAIRRGKASGLVWGPVETPRTVPKGSTEAKLYVRSPADPPKLKHLVRDFPKAIVIQLHARRHISVLANSTSEGRVHIRGRMLVSKLKT